MSKLNDLWKAFSRVIVTNSIRLYCKIVYRYKVIGKENIPKSGSLIFCGNHTSYLDGPLIIITSPRFMRFMAKQELRKSLLFRYLCYAYNAIYVKRDSKDIGPLKEALKELKSGGCIGIFPEGTRSKSGKLGQFYSAGFRRLEETVRLPVAVCAVDGGWRLSDVKRIMANLKKGAYYVKVLKVYDAPLNREEEKKILEEAPILIQKQLDEWRS